MAFFKLWWPGRKGGDDKKPKSTKAGRVSQAESVDAMRRRARHRLIGATVLVLAGVIGFPLLFDTQPRPVAVDIPIEIPDRHATAPLVAPAEPAPAATQGGNSAAAVVAARQERAEPSPTVHAASAARSARSQETQGLDPNEEVIAAAKPPRGAVSAGHASTSAASASAARTERKPDPKPDMRAAEAARAKALLEDKPVAPPVDTGRFIVQVGAFSDEAKAREARQKAEKAGLKTYTQVVETKEGKRIRVRIGPFTTRAEAEKAVSRAKGLDLPASLLTL
jgi:DedD protein